ncbi:MAG: DUF4342 domain-containing protein [Clostridiales bacterium]|nr:DUF4342 domain-containing protein [Clostridiales bacterium]
MDLEITLEMIDTIRERTGATYKEARDALTAVNGNVIDAIINIEEAEDKNWTETISIKGNQVVDKLKTVLKTGNVNRFRIKKDNTVILDIPVTAGAVSAVIIPKLTALGTTLALLSKCTIEVERQNKDIINVSNIINTAVGEVTNKVKNIADDVKNMADGCKNNAQANNMQNQPNNSDVNNVSVNNATSDINTNEEYPPKFE